VLAIADIKYRFRWISNFYPGSFTDGRIWIESRMKRAMTAQTWLPLEADGDPTRVVLHDIVCWPYIVADAAFAASPTILKPYTARQMRGVEGGRIYNKLISSNRQIIEQTWGIFVNRSNVFNGY